MSHRLLFRISTLLVLTVSISYWVYNNYILDNGEIITIYPDELPTKVRPQENERIIIANANSTIYENLRKKKVSKQVVLQPEPEKPLDITSQKPVDKEADSIEAIIAAIETEDIINSSLHGADKKIVENKVTKDDKPEKELSTTNIVNINQASLTKGLNIIKVIESSDLPKKQLLTKPKQTYYKIQLASVKSELVAKQEMERLKKKYSKIFNKTPLIIRKMRSEKGNFFYSVMGGNYENIGQAKAICKKLDSSQECLITNR